MPDTAGISPIGSTTEEAAQSRARRSAVYRAQHDRWRGSRELAWQLIRYRMDHGLTQPQLASQAGISYATLVRVERGQHSATPATRKRLQAVLTR